MGPKIEAIRRYLSACPHGRAIITDPPNLGRALAGADGHAHIPELMNRTTPRSFRQLGWQMHPIPSANNAGEALK